MKWILFILSFTFFGAFSQRKNLKDSTEHTFLAGVSYKANFTGLDLAERWKFTNQLGLDVNFKFKNNLIVGLEGGFLFGSNLQDPTIFKDLFNSYGTITGSTGEEAKVLFLMRGVSAHANAGYIFNRFGNNPNSGLWLSGGAGFFGHKIRIESTYNNVPQLEGDYKLGYDKLTMGISTKQFIGYLYQPNYRLLKFYGGFEFVQGFTKNVRTYNYDTGGPENELRLDFLYGFKVGWILPINRRTRGEYYSN